MVKRKEISNPYPADIEVANAIIARAAVSFKDSRKKFPERVTNVRPMAIIPTKAASLTIVFKLKYVRKFGAVTIPKINTAKKSTTSPRTKAE
tara:strand:+ start:925 stop:1200 length:276 start_codon:yes stop_codon:yes gene_type:complete